MNLPTVIKEWLNKKEIPLAHHHGALGERAAKKHLKQLGLKFLTANFRSDRGEIDLVFRDDDCLQFVSFAINIWSRYSGNRYEAKISDQLHSFQHARTT